MTGVQTCTLPICQRCLLSSASDFLMSSAAACVSARIVPIPVLEKRTLVEPAGSAGRGGTNGHPRGDALYDLVSHRQTSAILAGLGAGFVTRPDTGLTGARRRAGFRT